MLHKGTDQFRDENGNPWHAILHRDISHVNTLAFV